MKSFLVAAVTLLPLAAGCAGLDGLASMSTCQPESPTEITSVNVTLVYSFPEFLRRVAEAEERCAAAAASEAPAPPTTTTTTLQLDADRFHVVSLAELLQLRLFGQGSSEERTR